MLRRRDEPDTDKTRRYMRLSRSIPGGPRTSYQESSEVTDSFTSRSIAVGAESLPFASQQALAFTADYAAAYVKAHSTAGLSAERATLVAAGRLEWLLQRVRPTISGIFEINEISAILECYEDTLFFPDQFDDMPSDLLDHLADDSTLEHLPAPEVVQKVRKLTPVQRVTLADAIEQAWHRGIRAGGDWQSVFAELGIEFR